MQKSGKYEFSRRFRQREDFVTVAATRPRFLPLPSSNVNAIELAAGKPALNLEGVFVQNNFTMIPIEDGECEKAPR